MVDPQQYEFLLNTIGQEEGRKLWLDHKLKVKYIDLSMAKLENCSLSDYNFSEINLSTAILRNADLSGADLSDASLNYTDMRRINLHNAVLDRAILDSANLQDANLTDACLEQTKLRKAKLGKANLTGADLTGVDLSDADLRGACLKYTRLTGAKLTGADVAKADLTGAILDDDAPRQLLNFAQATVDDRKYREMRSHLNFPSEQTDLIRDANHHEDQNREEPPSAGPSAGLSTDKATKPLPDSGHPRHNGSAAKGPASASNGCAIPLRDKKPDLSTVEGCCQVLDVPVNAPLEAIVKAFRLKAKIYHPDKTRHLSERLQELASEEFRLLRQAYEALTCRTARPLVGIRWPDAMDHRSSPYDYTSAEYEILAKLNPANTNILYNMAWKYFEEGRHAKAMMGFQHVLILNPNDDDAQYNLMMVRLYCEIVLPALGPKGAVE